MTVQECYEQIGGDYADVVNRLRTDDRIKRFLGMVASDKSFDNLCAALAARNMEEAFRAAHTLKGVCLNLSLTNLHADASAVTEALRGKTEYLPAIEPLMEQLKHNYAQTVACIRSID